MFIGGLFDDTIFYSSAFLVQQFCFGGRIWGLGGVERGVGY
jgi:hypothetical protein